VLLEGLIPKRDDKGTLQSAHLEKLFIFSVMWSLGALLELEDRAKMEEFMVKHECDLNFPPTNEDETIFEYLVNENGNMFSILLQ
jgi:dynein heavy chain